MARIEGASNIAEVDETKALRSTLYPRGAAFCLGWTTSTIAAALAANSSICAFRLDPATALNAAIKRIYGTYTTIVAYTTPVTAGRRLSISRGAGAAASGGNAIAVPASKLSTDSSEMASANGGDIRVSTTGALTVTGITYEAQEFAQLLLVGNGTAGSIKDFDFKFNGIDGPPLILLPGQLMSIRNPQAMDAAGTWQLVANVEWEEYTP